MPSILVIRHGSRTRGIHSGTYARFMTGRMPFGDVDLDRLERLLWFLAAMGLALALLGVLGEYRGWWNDLGELFISFGTVASAATGVLALVINATKKQVRLVVTGVSANGSKLEQIREDHGSKLDRIHEDHGAKLDRIYEDHGSKLDNHGSKLDKIYEDHGSKLDRIHEDLSKGFDSVNENLENQHDVLVQIRDRL